MRTLLELVRALSWTRRNGLPFRVNHDYAKSTLRHQNVWRRPPTWCERLTVAAVLVMFLVLVVVMAWTAHTVATAILVH